MKKTSVKTVVLSVALLASSALAMAQPAAATIRVVNGQAYWSGAPSGGPVSPSEAGPYFAGREYRYDPHHYMGWYGSDPQDYRDVVYAQHSGRARCVFRQRVVNTNWEFQHPYLLVCRP